MGLFVGCIAILAPRLTLLAVVLLSDYIGQAYRTTLWPLLGFFFMPLTTLTYAWAVNTHHTVTGIYLVAVVVAVLIDLGLVRGSSRRRKR